MCKKYKGNYAQELFPQINWHGEVYPPRSARKLMPKVFQLLGAIFKDRFWDFMILANQQVALKGHRPTEELEKII